MKDFKPEIIWLHPEKLTPYANNAKKHPTEQIDKIAGQISKVGWTQPIVVDREHIIIAGHGRREAALRLGLQSVPVVVADHLDEYETMAARLADNKLAQGDFDEEKLKFDFGTLERQEFDLSMTGFDVGEIANITSGWESNLGSVDRQSSNTDGIVGIIKLSCPQEMRAELKEFIQKQINDSGFEGVEID